MDGWKDWWIVMVHDISNVVTVYKITDGTLSLYVCWCLLATNDKFLNILLSMTREYYCSDFSPMLLLPV